MNLKESIKMYTDYIEEHKSNVKRAWADIQFRCAHLPWFANNYNIVVLNRKVNNHDDSKYSKEEFEGYRQWFYNCGDDPIKCKVKLNRAWSHHIQYNSHHWQKWTKMEISKEAKSRCCMEMICDWHAMSFKFGKSAQRYYEENVDNIDIPGEYVNFMYEIFECLEGDINAKS